MLYTKKDNKMIILGINEFSLSFTKKYSNNYDIVMIRRDESVEELEIDAIITPIGNDILETLLRNDIKNSIFMALTENEEFNLFTTNLAGEYGARKTIAIVNNPNYINLSSANYIINPYQLLNDRIDSMIKENRLKNISNLIPGKINVIEYTLGKKDHYVYKKLKDIKLNNGMIFLINRNNKTILPNGDFELLPDDSLFILYKNGMLSIIFRQLFRKEKNRNKAFIIGGNEVLAKNLKNIFSFVILIESDLSNCRKLARRSEGIIIINGEGTEKKLLLEEGLADNSIFLAVDRDDYHNLLSSYQAKTLGCNNIITLLNCQKHMEIAEMLGLSNIISLSQLVTDHLNAYIRTGYLFNKYLLGTDVYTAKIKIRPDSEVINYKISKQKYSADFLVGVILRDSQIIIPDQDECILPGDEVLIFFYKNMETRIYNIFRQSVDTISKE